MNGNPDHILDEIAGYFEEKGQEIKIADGKYKINVKFIVEGEEPISMNIKILKADHD